MRFVVNKVALGHVLLRVLLFSSVNITPPMLNTRLIPHTALARRSIGQTVRTFHPKNNALSEIGDH
jgi:hypothetical protein